uniref:DUF4218 domain-containing protein n=1 Tax=Photinus pyralis TaxID=7054 RepID=A0A1Y1MKV3_PHOPY
MPKDFHLMSKRRKNQLIQLGVDQILNTDKDEDIGQTSPSASTTCSLFSDTSLEVEKNIAFYKNIPIAITTENENKAFVSKNSDTSLPTDSTDGASFVSLPDSFNHSSVSYNDVFNSCSSLSSSFNESVSGEENLKKELRTFIIECNVAHTTANKLLDILRRHGHDLPSDVRTLLSTPTHTTSRYVSTLSCGGQYCHLGLSYGIELSIRKYFLEIPKIIKFNINIDGLPLCKSSTSQFWPLLGSIVTDFHTEPFLIGVYFGKKKPGNANEYLKQFVDEYLQITENQLIICGVEVNVKLNALICDTPAKSFVCGTKGHTGYFGCGKCIQEGDFIQNRVVFPEIKSQLRTDSSFRNKNHPEHHVRDSYLEKLGVGMVSRVPLDYMHLVCLGVMKRLLQFWIKGRINLRLKEVDLISATFVNMKRSITKEFVRVPRSLLEIDHWKATEFRQFLLYSGPVLLLKRLPAIYYEHFISLTVALRILIDPELCVTLNKYADSLLVWFVKYYGELYGHEFLSYNVHNLVHLAGDVIELGPLDTFSAFKYENYMQKIKQKLKNSGNYLQQLVNRVHEENNLPAEYKVPKKYPIIVYFKNDLQVINCIKFNRFSISKSKYDNCVLLEDGTYGVIQDFSMKDNKCVVHILRFRNAVPFFNLPCDSLKIGVGVIHIQHGDVETIFLEQIKRKCIIFDYSDNCNNQEYVVVPLLHSE